MRAHRLRLLAVYPMLEHAATPPAANNTVVRLRSAVDSPGGRTYGVAIPSESGALAARPPAYRSGKLSTPNLPVAAKLGGAVRWSAVQRRRTLLCPCGAPTRARAQNSVNEKGRAVTTSKFLFVSCDLPKSSPL